MKSKKSRVKFQKQFAETNEELRQPIFKIDNLTTATSDQDVAGGEPHSTLQA